MNILFIQALLDEIDLLTWRDGIELVFLFIVFYQIIGWLRASSKPNLINWWIGYAAVAAIAYLLDMIGITFFLTKFFSLACVLSAVFHQETLQRLFFLPKRIIPATSTDQADWIEILMRSCLQTSYNKGNVVCIIERSDPVSSFFCSSSMLNVPCSYSLCSKIMLLYDSNAFLWAKAPNLLVAVDAEWSSQETGALYEEISLLGWRKQATILTNKTDAIVFCCDGQTQLFTIVAQGNFIEGISCSGALRILKNMMISGGALQAVCSGNREFTTTLR